MSKSVFVKILFINIIPFSFILFFSFLLAACSPKQQNPKQITLAQESLINIKSSKKLIIDTIDEQKKAGNISEKNNLAPIPTLPISSSIPDFTSFKNVKQKKRAFFNFLKPYIQSENNLILTQRKFIKDQYAIMLFGDSIIEQNLEQLKVYIIDYRCQNTNLDQKATFEELLIRVDIIPPELALVQAALESSWGSSYFAQVANNFFGQWCFNPGCGVIPRSRKQGETHEVAKFKTVNLSVRSYILFLNSHPFFDLLRNKRAENRKQNKQPSAYEMAKGLKAYSARGDTYIREVQSMIKSNRTLLIDAKISSKDQTIEE